MASHLLSAKPPTKGPAADPTTRGPTDAEAGVPSQDSPIQATVISTRGRRREERSCQGPERTARLISPTPESLARAGTAIRVTGLARGEVPFTSGKDPESAGAEAGALSRGCHIQAMAISIRGPTRGAERGRGDGPRGLDISQACKMRNWKPLLRKPIP